MLFLLVGKIGSGKSTCADILRRDFAFEEFSFADPIKKFAVLLGFDEKDVFGSQEDKNRINEHFHISGRQFMQRFGTDIMRDYTGSIFDYHIDNIWTKSMEIKLKTAMAKGQNVVVSDGRFLDEAKLIKNLGGIIIRLKRGDDKYVSDHVSETEMTKIVADVEYDNVGTIDDMKIFCQDCVHRFANPPLQM